MYGHHKNLDDNHLMRFAGRFSRRVYGWAKKEGIPVIATKKGERKHLISQKYIPSDPDFEGVFLVICSQLPAIVWSVKRLPGGDFHLKRKTPLPFVKHYFFHIMDKRWGHVTIALDIKVGQQRPTEAAVFVAKKSGGGSTFVSIPILSSPVIRHSRR